MSRRKSRKGKSKKSHQSHPTSTEIVTRAQPFSGDETLFECACTQWQFGDWQRLARLDSGILQRHPQRARLALLVAAARFQLGEVEEAHRYLRLAEDWGCSRNLIVQMLISGTHNSLACASLLVGREEKAAQHFHHAVTLGGVPGDPLLLTEVRSRLQRAWLKI